MTENGDICLEGLIIDEIHNNEVCSICLEELIIDKDRKNISVTNCSHMFHTSCILRVENFYCPICREIMITEFPPCECGNCHNSEEEVIDEPNNNNYESDDEIEYEGTFENMVEDIFNSLQGINNRLDENEEIIEEIDNSIEEIDNSIDRLLSINQSFPSYIIRDYYHRVFVNGEDDEFNLIGTFRNMLTSNPSISTDIIYECLLNIFYNLEDRMNFTIIDENSEDFTNLVNNDLIINTITIGYANDTFECFELVCKNLKFVNHDNCKHNYCQYNNCCCCENKEHEDCCEGCQIIKKDNIVVIIYNLQIINYEFDRLLTSRSM